MTHNPGAKHMETAQAHHHEESTPPTSAEGHERRKYPSALVAGVGVLMLVAAVGGVILAFWALHASKEARHAEKEAADAREQTLKEVEQQKHQREQAETARKSLADERDTAVEAEKEAKESVEELKTVLSFFQRNVLSAGRPLGWTGNQGKDVSLRKAVDAAERKVASVFAGKPLAEASIREMLGSTYLDLEAPEMAVKQYERAMALREALQNEDHPDAVACRNQLAVAYRQANQHIQASRLYEKDKESSTHASALAIRASMLLSKKKPLEAEKLLRECLTIREKIKPDDWSTFAAKSMLGEALLDQKKYSDAERLLLSGYEGMKKRENKIPTEERFRIVKELERLVLLYESWGKQDEANKWGKELTKAQDALIRSTK